LLISRPSGDKHRIVAAISADDIAAGQAVFVIFNRFSAHFPLTARLRHLPEMRLKRWRHCQLNLLFTCSRSGCGAAGDPTDRLPAHISG
jgi:hypothetical protein